MLFNSPLFLFAFLPLTLITYYALGMTRIRMFPAVGIVIASLAFYSWYNPVRLLSIILLSICFNYCAGSWLMRQKNTYVLTFAVIFDLTLLFYFKYFNFFIQNLSALGLYHSSSNVILPIGISFYTFTQIAFLVDAFRGQVRYSNVLDYILFVTYFPHLIAGPILHHAEMMPQFADNETYRFHADHVAKGAAWFALGLFKKVVLADSIARYADAAFGAASTGAHLPAYDVWVGALSYTFQIYFDFSGYSDMAMGLALMMNIRFPINFFSPYKAESIIEFWRRWHMTLSRFLRDYLYIALGGNRKGSLRRHANLFATMILGGLWHGASWTFVLWGAIHGAALIINHAFRALTMRGGIRLPRPIAQSFTLSVVIVAWVPFRADDLPSTWILWRSMIHADAPGPSVISDPLPATLWLASLACIALLMPNTAEVFQVSEQTTPFRLSWMPSRRWALACGICFGMAVAMSMTHPSAFLYFRF